MSRRDRRAQAALSRTARRAIEARRPLRLQCGPHGSVPWQLTLICVDCGRAYQAVREGDDFKPLCPGAQRAPNTCACGADFRETARACCTECFKSKVAQQESGPS